MSDCRGRRMAASGTLVLPGFSGPFQKIRCWAKAEVSAAVNSSYLRSARTWPYWASSRPKAARADHPPRNRRIVADHRPRPAKPSRQSRSHQSAERCTGATRGVIPTRNDKDPANILFGWRRVCMDFFDRSGVLPIRMTKISLFS